MTFVIHFIMCMLATIGFGIVFNGPKEELIYIGFSGGVCWIIYLLFNEGIGWNSVLSILLASIGTTIFCRAMAAYRRCPVTVYLLAALFPLVPGGRIYYTAYYMFMKDQYLFMHHGLMALEIAMAIAVGISLGFGIPQEFFGLFRKRG
ncbi:MAG: threonine/serine exporter family protein [Lachnospiraceae bacterium]|nr:threonine/serine exporter family protein [Lachnospiraceae bacterium]